MAGEIPKNSAMNTDRVKYEKMSLEQTSNENSVKRTNTKEIPNRDILKIRANKFFLLPVHEITP